MSGARSRLSNVICLHKDVKIMSVMTLVVITDHTKSAGEYSILYEADVSIKQEDS